MNSLKEETEFDVLGYSLKLSSTRGEDRIAPAEVVSYLLKEANQIRENAPHLEPGQVAILAALKIAEERLALDIEYHENVDKLQSSARDALQFIEEVSPTTV
jgi:cell division protein ZapA (FtsZ GTPase activity inhibitor)